MEKLTIDGQSKTMMGLVNWIKLSLIIELKSDKFWQLIFGQLHCPRLATTVTGDATQSLNSIFQFFCFFVLHLSCLISLVLAASDNVEQDEIISVCLGSDIVSCSKVSFKACILKGGVETRSMYVQAFNLTYLHVLRS